MSTWYPFPPDNGFKKRVYHLLKALSQRFKVSLLSFEFGDAVRPVDRPPEKWRLSVSTLSINPFIYNRQGALKTFLSRVPLVNKPIPDMVEEVTRMMREKHFDAVIASDEVMSHYALMLPNETVKLLDLHIVLNHLMQERFMHHRQHPQAARYWLSWKKVNRYEAFLFNRFDRLITVSEYEKQVSIENLGNVQPAISVIPNGAECIPNQVDPVEKHETRLVYSGALTYDANYDAMAYFLSEIYPVIRRGRPDTTLMITGSLEGVKIDALAIDDSVTLTGYVNDVRPIVSSAAVCIVPLRFGGGTRLKILEALALGTPVVSTQKGVEGLALVHEQHLLVADTPADFASATLRLLSDPIVRERLKEDGQRRVQELYDWERIGVNFAGVVEATIKSRKPI